MTRLPWTGPGSYESHVEREKGYSAMSEDKDYGPLPDREDSEAAELLAGALEDHSRLTNATGGYRLDFPNMTGKAAKTLRALLAERDRLDAENEGALAIIATERAEVLKFRAKCEGLEAENQRLRDVISWYDDTLEKHVTHTGKPARICDANGVWHDGPAADMAQKILRGLQELFRTALAQKEKDHD